MNTLTMRQGPLEKGVLFNGLFVHTTEPLTINRDSTQLYDGVRDAVGRINQFQYPTTSFSVRIGKNGLGDVAKEHGINTIYYADIEKWSMLVRSFGASISCIFTGNKSLAWFF